MFKKSFIALATAGALAVTLVGCATGAGDGSVIPKRVEIIVPWGAGGGSDQATRQLVLGAEETCGTTFVVSNRTGAAGATGHEAGAAAKADGKTLTDMTAEVTILPHLGNTTVSYKDFTPIMRFASISPAFVVPKDSPFKSIDDMVSAMESDDKVRIGTTGAGGIWDIAAGGFEQAADVDFTERVPYDGGAAIIQAVLGGHIEVGVLAAPEVLAQSESGELRVLAIADDERTAILPDVPTLKEQGYDWATRTWFGVAGPAGLEQEQVSALEECLTESWESDEYQTFLKNQGYNAAYLDTADFTEFVKGEDELFAELVPALYSTN